MSEPRRSTPAGGWPPVVALVCNFNGRVYLEACLTSLSGQTVPPHRIVVYDNASTDDSVAFLRARFPAVEVVAMGANRGPCAARNRGLAEADTEWALELDSDVALAPDCLERLLAEALGAPDVALVMPRAVFAHDPSLVHYDGGFFHYVGVLSLRHFFQPLPARDEPPQDVDAAIAMALLVHVPRVRAAGGYHEDYFILFEDHDLSYRLRSRGFRIRLVPAALVYHREGTAGLSYRAAGRYPPRRAYLHSRNRWMLLARNHGPRALLLGLPGILLYEVTWFLFALRHRNVVPWLRGKIDAAGMARRLWRQRREIQRARVVSDRALLTARPLTHAPMAAGSRPAQTVERALDAVLAGWWRLVRPLLP